MKEKIAISIDQNILEAIDNYVNGSSIRSRSQAIELLLQQSIKQKPTTTAIMLIHKKEIPYLFKEFEGFTLIQHHLNFLIKNKIKQLYLITKENEQIKELIKEMPRQLQTTIINEEQQEGTASALKLAKDKVDTDFIVINGDTFNNFDLKKMIQKHKQNNKTATIGLISSKKPTKFGAAVLDGEMIIDFKEKGKESDSYIINAGIYILKPNIFQHLTKETKSLERDLFPKLAKNNQLVGYFTHGSYIHAPER